MFIYLSLSTPFYTYFNRYQDRIAFYSSLILLFVKSYKTSTFGAKWMGCPPRRLSDKFDPLVGSRLMVFETISWSRGCCVNFGGKKIDRTESKKVTKYIFIINSLKMKYLYFVMIY